MNTITKPAPGRTATVAPKLKPAVRVAVAIRAGGSGSRRHKQSALTPKAMEAEVDRICAGCPAMDTLEFLQEGET